ncbi:MAG: HesA/MoeB/ThiF family protein [Lentisphaerae bacterium]|jgi:adenylyltransferase/sulfurtransferase|nr:HesA/MoeB/ThiF family protein [Lentisphaerota bacterium]
MTLSPAERQRYARHLDLPALGEAGQEKLHAGSVLVVGCGGLGSPVLLYLAAVGVGRLGFMDPDIVSISNLQRQVVHVTTDIGRLKTESATSHLRELNPHVRLEAHPERLEAANAREHFANYDLVVDATDNYAAKYLINDICVELNKPFIHAGISAHGGQLMTVLPGQSACLRCIQPDAPANAPADAGPLGPLPGVIGSLQALEAFKFLTGIGPLLTDRVLAFDALTTEFHAILTNRDPACPACGAGAPTKE